MFGKLTTGQAHHNINSRFPSSPTGEDRHRNDGTGLRAWKGLFHEIPADRRCKSHPSRPSIADRYLLTLDDDRHLPYSFGVTEHLFHL